jgi:hypothetical protein
MIRRLISAEYDGDYSIVLHYQTGESRKANLKDILDKGIYKELTDKTLFQSFKIIFNTLEWPNGADIDPESLYNISQPYHK